jgi:hypothetical protein
MQSYIVCIVGDLSLLGVTGVIYFTRPALQYPCNHVVTYTFLVGSLFHYQFPATFSLISVKAAILSEKLVA